MTQKSRVRNLSTRYLNFYRYGAVFMITCLFGALVFGSIQNSKDNFSFLTLYFPVFWGFLIYKWIDAHLKVFKVEFDDDFLYILRRNQDIMIPLENIKDIEMKSLGGMWRVDLLYADVIGDHFYFKPSLLYPLNYKVKDELVNLLWRKIEIAKTKRREFLSNALTS